jgi:cyclomaltodextrinase / maltogenic alpha-amylase / neopullulanase
MNNWIKTLSVFIIISPIISAVGKDMDKKDFVPQWAKEVVWYQIFPERFRNGDKTNDPDLNSIKGSWPHDDSSPWQVHPWTSDWYLLQDYEKKNGKDIWFNIQRRRYGGDLQGIIDKLDYLKDIGISAIYLNPVFESPSSHKYDEATYHHVDPFFGPDPRRDKKLIAAEDPGNPKSWVWTSADKLLLKLIREVHNRNMYIIIDGVFNHMGINSWAFRDVVKNQKKSKYKNWFNIISWDDPKKGTKFDYKGWFGVKELPELKQDKNGTVSGPKKYIFNITKRWMDPYNNGSLKDGIDGWRLDVAFCIKHPFWKDWRNLVKSINPNAYLTAEVIDPINVIEPYLQGDEFDAVMNYNFAFASADYFVNEKNQIKTSAFDTLLKKLRDAFPGGVEYVQQNLFGSHDSNRLESHIVNRDHTAYRNWGNYFQYSKGSNPQYDTRKPNPDELKVQKLFVIFQMTYVGAPMVYYGDEAGMWGANDPDCRKPMVWNDLTYDNESLLPDQSKKLTSDKVEFNSGLFDHYKKLISIRNNIPALKKGDFKTLLTDDINNIYSFERNLGNEKVVVVLNNGYDSKEIKLPVIGEFLDLLNNNEKFHSSSEMNLTIPGKWGRILVKQ